MLGPKTFISNCILIMGMTGAPLAAADADYFPLQVGNQWIYQSTSRFFTGPANVVSIPGKKAFGSTSYFIVEGLNFEPMYVRSDDAGVLYAYDANTGSEAQYAAFATPVGGSYRTVVDPCNSTANVVSRNAKVSTPAGEFEGALQVEYPAANCADAGIGSDHFVPYIGLVKREGITIAGPRAMELVYARVGGVTVLSAPEVSFSMSLDRAVYDVNGIPMLNARLTLRNTTAQPIELTFPSGQRFDLIVRNAAGTNVATWSANKLFAAVIGVEKIGPGERNWTGQLPLQDGQNKRLPAGKYTIEGFLTVQGTLSPYSAKVGFEIIPEAEPAQP